ncbi:hypothetical protein MTO96_049463 [Rhipicephalus appendiculatus]
MDEEEEGYVEEAGYQPSYLQSRRWSSPVPLDRNLVPEPSNKKIDMLRDRTAEDDKHINCTLNGSGHRAIGFITEWVAAYKFVKANKEKFILYVLLSLGCGVVAFLAVLSARLYAQRRRDDSPEPETKCSEPLSGSFDECDGGGGGVDQVDASTGGSATRHAHTIEVVRYANRPGIRRHDSDTYPRAPVTRSTTSYYYS